MSTQLPEDFVADGMRRAPGCYYMLVPVLELSREELIAALLETGESLRATQATSHEASMFGADMMRLACRGR